MFSNNTASVVTCSNHQSCSWMRKFYVLDCISSILVLIYFIAFCRSLSGLLFDPGVANDDAYQQLFPFYSAIDPKGFDHDLAFTAMRGYLYPLHWWLGVLITKLTLNPVMTGHWISVIQICLAMFFVWLAARRESSVCVANFCLGWLLV